MIDYRRATELQARLFDQAQAQNELAATKLAATQAIRYTLQHPLHEHRITDTSDT
jgi:hypothetical protein